MTHSSYHVYFSAIKSVMKSNMKSMKSDPVIGKDFEKVFLSKLMNQVKLLWRLYERGDRDTYKLLDYEIDDLWEKSIQESIAMSLEKLYDQGMINMSVNSRGQIVYSPTNLGKSLLDKWIR